MFEVKEMNKKFIQIFQDFFSAKRAWYFFLYTEKTAIQLIICLISQLALTSKIQHGEQSILTKQIWEWAGKVVSIKKYYDYL